MNITDHIVTEEFTHALHSLTDNCGTQMTDMKRFCYICTTVIDDDRLTVSGLLKTQFFFLLHTAKVICKVLRI